MTDHIDGALALSWLNTFTADFHDAQQALTDLDRQAGDGDFGTNIASALRKVGAELPTADATFASVFTATANGFLATGGTSGPLFGMWFRAISRSTAAEGTDTDLLAQGVAAGLAKVQSLGGASVGDNTMIDALAPASQALLEASTGGLTVDKALATAAEAARAGAASTADLLAARGRASYVGDLALGVEDPGAVTVALFFEAGAAVVSG
jgi:dihydroxyacetone kinase-like protein